MIHVGLVIYGSSSATVDVEEAIAALRSALEAADTGPSGVDLVFVLGGRLRDADFEGIRVGRLSRARKLLQVQIGLPRHALAGPEAVNSVRSLAAEAIRIGAERLEANGLPIDPSAALGLLPGESADVFVSDVTSSSPTYELRLADREGGYDVRALAHLEDVVQRNLESEGVAVVDGHEVDGSGATLFIRGGRWEHVADAVASAISSHDIALGSFLVMREPATDDERIIDLSLFGRPQ